MSDEQQTSGEDEGELVMTLAAAPALAQGALPATLPVLPLKNTVLFPFLLSPLLVNTDRAAS